MAKIKKVIILGTSATAREIVDTINLINQQLPTLKCLGFLEDNQAKRSFSYLGFKVLGSLVEAKKFKDAYFINSIASPGSFWAKESIINKTGITKSKFINIIHPSASVSPSAILGQGLAIFQNVVVGSNTKIGDHVMVLPNTVISHDCVIGDYTSITGGVCLSGNVAVGQSCYLGTNSTYRGEVQIGEQVLVGAGSVVLSDLKPRNIYVGNPTRLLKKVNIAKK